MSWWIWVPLIWLGLTVLFVIFKWRSPNWDEPNMLPAEILLGHQSYLLDPPPSAGDLLLASIPVGEPIPPGWTPDLDRVGWFWRVSDGTEIRFAWPVVRYYPSGE